MKCWKPTQSIDIRDLSPLLDILVSMVCVQWPQIYGPSFLWGEEGGLLLEEFMAFPCKKKGNKSYNLLNCLRPSGVYKRKRLSARIQGTVHSYFSSSKCTGGDSWLTPTVDSAPYMCVCAKVAVPTPCRFTQQNSRCSKRTTFNWQTYQCFWAQFNPTKSLANCW